MKQNSTTAHAIPAATLLIALTRTSTEVQEAAASLLLLGAEMFPWMNIAIQSEIERYLKEQKTEDEWIEREALLDEQRMLISREAYYTDARYQ